MDAPKVTVCPVGIPRGYEPASTWFKHPHNADTDKTIRKSSPALQMHLAEEARINGLYGQECKILKQRKPKINP